ncbi:MAG: chromosome segregation protein SMC [Bryobacteraceae bacterium]|nr:chromosome segregation protein SMC [Bryobacteraceae bacterium]
MLKVKRVEIQGFKSFCDRTEMKFLGHGIAAIVGPNGCGKSNLSDAINWVLGEQSAKSLRGARMEDVIFAGTRDRKPMGMAAVTLTLVDPEYYSEDTAPTDVATNGDQPLRLTKPKEITVTRRLFRNGESEYLVDGKQARLRDIQDIFMGTGLGPESYAIIEQGRIGQILSTKPADRRSVIEEAAGITRFKTKRRLAESKLESAKQNLNRVFDILEEVGRQVNSLKRQAAKAQRYAELRTEMVASLRLALAGKFRLLERSAAKTALDLNVAGTELQELTKEVAEKEQSETTLYEAAIETEAKLTAARQTLGELKLEAERTRGKLFSQKNQVDTMEKRLADGEGETSSIEQRLMAIGLEVAAQLAIVTEVTLAAETGRARLAAATQERQQLQADLSNQERQLEGSRQQVLKMLGEASTLKNQLAQLDTQLAGMTRDSERLVRDEKNATGELERLEEIKGEISTKLSTRQMQLQSLGDQRKEVEAALTDHKQQAAEARKQLEEARQEASRLKARKDSLDEIINHRAYTTESVKRLFSAIDKGQASDLKPVGVLADFVEVDTQFEKATEEFLHEELEYVVVKTWPEAQQGVELMRGDLDGRATFLVHPNPELDFHRGTVAMPTVGPETGIIARLSDVLRLTNGLTHAPADLLPRLSRCFLTENREAAQRLALQYPDIYFLLPDGVCYHGYAVSGGKKTSSGPLALKRELREITVTWEQREAVLMESQVRVQRLDAQIQKLSEQLEHVRVAQQQEEKETLALGHEHRKLAEEHARSSQRLSVARLDLDRLTRDRERANEQKSALEEQWQAKENARLELEQSLAHAREELTGLQAQLQSANEEHSGLRAELAGLEERQRSANFAKARFDQQVQELTGRQNRLSEELERLGVERARLLAHNIELDQNAASYTERIAEVEASVAELHQLETTQRADFDQLSEALKGLRSAAAEAQEKRQQIEVGLVQKRSELKFLDETARKELQTPLEELAAAMETEPDEIVLLEAEEKYQEVRGRIDAMGPVNPQALEEYEEAQQRYDFLNTQRQDLLDSIRDTEKTIQEIDVESRKRFVEAFEAINANFRHMFGVLFNGGIGEMRLTDQDQSHESGIDIVAQPPGKKLQNVLLLSGGERAMTAMALLMAVFKYQPSPFCILDEVDAPLDEPNIIRLTKLLKEMSDQTQFIVITHAKRTMEAAAVLYGVTMQEPGVSKLVSVRFGAPVSAPPPPPMSVPAAMAPAN